MNITALDEIKNLRNGEEFEIDTRNSNRYRIVTRESHGLTSYCFSTPIYNSDTRKLVSKKFLRSGNGYRFDGSSCEIALSSTVCRLKSNIGNAKIVFDDECKINVSEAARGGIFAAPSMNGVIFTVSASEIAFYIETDSEYSETRSSKTSFSLMREKFKPFICVSALYALDSNGLPRPAILEHDKAVQGKCKIKIIAPDKSERISFEVNIHESKLFQDTTVESRHPNMNNAYGAIGFIGATEEFGEQWLYSRPDFTKIQELCAEPIERALLHIPIHSEICSELDVFVPMSRFCSFGSTWNKKVGGSDQKHKAEVKNGYLTIDVTDIFTDHDRCLHYNEGIILRKPKGEHNYVTISTGDNCSRPQILEIKHKHN